MDSEEEQRVRARSLSMNVPQQQPRRPKLVHPDANGHETAAAMAAGSGSATTPGPAGADHAAMARVPMSISPNGSAALYTANHPGALYGIPSAAQLAGSATVPLSATAAVAAAAAAVATAATGMSQPAWWPPVGVGSVTAAMDQPTSWSGATPPAAASHARPPTLAAGISPRNPGTTPTVAGPPGVAGFGPPSSGMPAHLFVPQSTATWHAGAGAQGIRPGLVVSVPGAVPMVMPSALIGAGSAIGATVGAAVARPASPAPIGAVGPPAAMLPLQFYDVDIDNLVELTAENIERIIAHNDRLPFRPEDVTRFHSQAPANISVRDYLRRIVRFCSLEKCCIPTILVYMDRMRQRGMPLIVSSITVHRIIITAVVVATKTLCDNYYTNEHYAKVGGLTMAELNVLELELLTLLDWRLNVVPEVLQIYYVNLARSSQKFAAAAKAVLAANPLPTPRSPVGSPMMPGSPVMPGSRPNAPAAASASAGQGMAAVPGLLVPGRPMLVPIPPRTSGVPPSPNVVTAFSAPPSAPPGSTGLP